MYKCTTGEGRCRACGGQRKISPLNCEVIIILSFGGDVLPQLVRSQAGPRGVVAAPGHPVTTFAAFTARNQLVGWQVGDGIREGAQEAV